MAQRKSAEPEAPDLEDYREAYLACRDLRHNWKYPGVFYKGAHGGLQRVLSCTVCRSTREDRYEGGEVHRTYHYSDGYLLPEAGRVAAQVVRAEVMRRVKVYPSQKAMLEALRGAKGARASKVIDIREKRHARAS